MVTGSAELEEETEGVVINGRFEAGELVIGRDRSSNGFEKVITGYEWTKPGQWRLRLERVCRVYICEYV